MTLNRFRLAAASAVALGVAAATAGAAVGVAASTPAVPSTPGSTPNIFTTYSTPMVTLKCPSSDIATPPSFQNVTFSVSLPASFRPGASFINPGGALSVTASVKFEEYGSGGGPATRSFRILSGTLGVDLSGVSQSSYSYALLQSPIVPIGPDLKTFTPLTSPTVPFPTVTAPAGGTVDVAFGGVSYKIETFATPDGTGPGVTSDVYCFLLSSAPTVRAASIPVAGDPVITPSPTPTVTPTPVATPSPGPTPTPTKTPGPTPSPTKTPTPTPPPAAKLPTIAHVIGSGYGYLGGFVTVTGQRLSGLKSLTVGGAKAKIVLTVGDVVVAIAPPKAPGRYPVVATTAAGASPVTAATTYRYASLF